MKKIKIILGVLPIILLVVGSTSFAIGLTSTNVNQSPFDCATGATICNLSYKNISSIAANTFINHHNLTNLTLSSNAITSLVSGSFNGLSGLQFLYIAGNQISYLPNGVFHGLSSLITLQLAGNNIASVPSGLFNDLSHLQSLYIGGNQITSLSNVSFNGISGLVHLDLPSNYISSLSRDAFTSLPRLQFLNLADNQITSLANGSFTSLSEVNYLDLSFNQLTSFSSDTFNGLSGLASLDLSFNQINSLSNSSFTHLSGLQTLDLSYNCGSTTIIGDWGSSIMDTNNCAIASADTSTFDTAIGSMGYGLNGAYYEGFKGVIFNGGGSILSESIIMQNYDTSVQVQYDVGTEITQNGDVFFGVLHAPVNLPASDAIGLSSVVSLIKFGSTNQSINFSQPITIRMPVPGMNEWDSIAIYSTNDDISTVSSPTWTFETRAMVTLINGNPYVEFTTTHATYFSATLPGGGPLPGGGGGDVGGGTGVTCAPGTACGQLTMKILAGKSSCQYGTTLDFGTNELSYTTRSLITGFVASGGATARFCEDQQGIDTRNLTIQSTDLVNTTTNVSAQTIPASRIFIKNPAAYILQGECTIYSGESLNQWVDISSPRAIFGKLGNIGEGCKIMTNNVLFRVDLTGAQAIGQYSATITINLPSLFL